MSLTINYFNQYIDLIWKSMDCFIYDRDLHHERVTKGSLLEQGGGGGGEGGEEGGLSARGISRVDPVE